MTAPFGEVFAEFRMQDSGSVSYGVQFDGRRLFMKLPTEPSFRRAVDVHAAISHPAIIPLLGTLATEALICPWVDGEVLYGAPVGGRAQRLDPGGPHARFRSLPVADIVSALDAIFDAHLAVAAGGFVSVDLYDGCFIYDFTAGRMWICDLDEYRPGPFRVEVDRLPGSTRFMAPEELRRGAIVDQRTTVFHLGRTGLCCSTPATWKGRSGATRPWRRPWSGPPSRTPPPGTPRWRNSLATGGGPRRSVGGGCASPSVPPATTSPRGPSSSRWGASPRAPTWWS